MNSASVLKNLNKLDDICRFISLCGLIQAQKNAPDTDLIRVKKDLDYSLHNLVINLDRFFIKDISGPLKLNLSLSNALKNLKESSLSDQVEDFQFLIKELNECQVFFQKYEDQPIQFSVQNHEEIKNLRTKTLLILSERFG